MKGGQEGAKALEAGRQRGTATPHLQEDRRPRGRRDTPQQLLGEPGLADAGLALEHHQPGDSGVLPGEQGMEFGELPVPPNEVGREERRRARLHAPAGPRTHLR